MLGRVLHWLSGRRAEGRGAEDRARAAGQGGRERRPVSGAGVPDADAASEATRRVGRPSQSPAFSSRAVHDAAIVTSAIEAMRRYADGQEPAADLAVRLTALTAEQAGFLQLSVESALLNRCVARAADERGAQGAELRRRLAELADGAPPRRGLAAVDGPVYGPRSSFGPARGSAVVDLPKDFLPEPVPVPQSVEREPPPVPPPVPPPRAASPGIPRISRSAATDRRARLKDALSAALPAKPSSSQTLPPQTLLPGEDAR